jgi:hypothetical protein
MTAFATTPGPHLCSRFVRRRYSLSPTAASVTPDIASEDRDELPAMRRSLKAASNRPCNERYAAALTDPQTEHLLLTSDAHRIALRRYRLARRMNKRTSLFRAHNQAIRRSDRWRFRCRTGTLSAIGRLIHLFSRVGFVTRSQPLSGLEDAPLWREGRGVSSRSRSRSRTSPRPSLRHHRPPPFASASLIRRGKGGKRRDVGMDRSSAAGPGSAVNKRR